MVRVRLETEVCPPAAETEGLKITGSARSTNRVQPTADTALLARRADYALRVVTQRRDGHMLTRFYATLAGGEAALRRAKDRGAPAVMHLVRIMPTTVSIADAADFGLLGSDPR